MRKLTPGYTAIPNHILEKIITLKLSGREFRILLYILRKTYGYHKKQDAISLSQIAKATKIARNHCATLLNSPPLSDIIFSFPVDPGHTNIYAISRKITG